MADKIKIALAVLLLIAGLVGFYYFSTLHGVARAGIVLAGVVAALLVAAWSAPGQQALVFIREANEERRKVVWPTGKESVQTAAAVFAFVTVMAIFLWLVDKLVEWGLYDALLGWK
jgi:preprotein translocase subunit SecE